jgi:hypothetical protein
MCMVRYLRDSSRALDSLAAVRYWLILLASRGVHYGFADVTELNNSWAVRVQHQHM